MENKTQTPDVGGRSFIQFLTLAVFLWGAAMMFPKTVDLLAHYSPDSFMGYVGTAYYYAMGSALLIEGVMVIMKIKTWLSPSKNLIEWAADIVLSVAPYLLSTAAQVLDSMYVQGTLQEQPAEVQLAITFLAPALPALMVGLLIVFSLYESAPAGLFGGSTVGNVGRPSKMRLRVGKLPWWSNPRNWKLAMLFEDKPGTPVANKPVDAPANIPGIPGELPSNPPVPPPVNPQRHRRS